MKNRKTMKPAKFDELDRVLYEWFKQRRSEGIPISGFILREKAREFHQTMDLEVSVQRWMAQKILKALRHKTFESEWREKFR